MDDGTELLIGSRGTDHVFLGLSQLDKDGNAKVHIQVRSGPFTGDFASYLHMREILPFAKELQKLYETLSGKATIHALERCIDFEMEGNGRGQVQVRGRAMADPARNASLDFNFVIDQTFLPPMLTTLGRLLEGFP